MRDRRCKKSEQQIAEELTGNWRVEHLFNLRQALKMYDQFCQTVGEYDAEILAYIKTLQPDIDDDQSVLPPISPSKTREIAKKGQAPMRQALYQLTGFDLTTIDGIGADTASVVLSELGFDYSAFSGENHFVSYLRLAPNLSISAGKKVPSRLKGTTTSRVGTALRMAALALRNSKTALGAFYRRISRRKGASVAVFATARKLAQIIYRLVCYGQAYIDIGAQAYENRFNSRRLIHFTKALKDMGYKIEPLAAQKACSAC
jgi:transposase